MTKETNRAELPTSGRACKGTARNIKIQGRPNKIDSVNKTVTFFLISFGLVVVEYCTETALQLFLHNVKVIMMNMIQMKNCSRKVILATPNIKGVNFRAHLVYNM